MTTSTTSAMTELCIRSMDLMATGSPEDFEQIYHPQAVNREAAVEPPAARQPGPAGFYATAEWLRAAFSGLRWEVHEAVERDDLVVLHVTMHGHHTGDFVTYQPGTATVDAAMPPTGKPFAVTQTHWCPHPGRHDHRALGQPRRPGHGQASRMGAPIAGVLAARGTRQAACPEAPCMTPALPACARNGWARDGHRLMIMVCEGA